MVGGRTTSVVLYGRFVQVARDAHFIELEFVFEDLQAQDGYGPCWIYGCIQRALNFELSGYLKVDNLCYVKSKTNTPNPLPNATAQELPASVPINRPLTLRFSELRASQRIRLTPRRREDLFSGA